MKRCSKCRITKEQVLFSKNKSNKDGLHNECRVCVKERDTVRSKKKIINKWTLEEERNLLFGIKRMEDWAFKELTEKMRDILKFHISARVGTSINGKQGFEDAFLYLNDRLIDRAMKLSKKPERRNLNKINGKPTLFNYLARCAKFDLVHFIVKDIETNFYKNRKHQKIDRKEFPLTMNERGEIARQLKAGVSPYKVALDFSISYERAFDLRKRLTNPVAFWESQARKNIKRYDKYRQNKLSLDIIKLCIKLQE